MQNQQEKRSASDIYLAFEYQWDFFVLEVVKLLEEDDVVSFECLDDVARQTNNEVILYQIKHSLRKKANGETINLTNRDSDLWKTITVWMDFIEENEEANRDAYINKNRFVFVTNKTINSNAFGDALQKYKQNGDLSAFRNRINEIKEKGDSASLVTRQIERLVNASYLETFVKHISLNFVPNELELEIKRKIGVRFALKEDKINSVYEHLMARMRDDAKELIRNQKKIQYDCHTIQERYWTIINEGREKLVFRTDFPRYDGNPRDLMFIKQLIAVNDITTDDCDDIANYTNQWFQFHNNFKEKWNNHDINDRDVQNLTTDVDSVWRDSRKQFYRKLTKLSSVQDLDDAANNVLTVVRKEPMYLAQTPLGQALSRGCFYYYSNDDSTIVTEMPRIGWHIDWRAKFKKE